MRGLVASATLAITPSESERGTDADRARATATRQPHQHELGDERDGRQHQCSGPPPDRHRQEAGRGAEARQQHGEATHRYLMAQRGGDLLALQRDERDAEEQLHRNGGNCRHERRDEDRGRGPTDELAGPEEGSGTGRRDQRSAPRVERHAHERSLLPVLGIERAREQCEQHGTEPDRVVTEPDDGSEDDRGICGDTGFVHVEHETVDAQREREREQEHRTWWWPRRTGDDERHGDEERDAEQAVGVRVRPPTP